MITSRLSTSVSFPSSTEAYDRIVLFTRLPRPGRSKTRLIPALGEDGAARLQRRMTMHCIATCREYIHQAEGTCLEVRYTDCSPGQVKSWLGSDLAYSRQGKGDLGDKLARSFNHAIRKGTARTLIVGADCPALTPEIIEEAFRQLQRHDAVVGPATDGGYYLIGLNANAAGLPWKNLFQNISWGGATVLTQTLANARSAGIDIHQLSALTDIDRPEDLHEWERIARQTAGRRENRLAVIIPAYNEEENIDRIVSQARHALAAEVYVVDGGSTDTTARRAEEAGAHVLTASSGRARQMNAGAAESDSGMLLFLHADSQLPRDYDAYIRYALSMPGIAAGAFRFRLDHAALRYRLLARLVNWRCRILQLPYGDQGLFMRRSTFAETGGFSDMPLLEDVEMIHRLRRTGRIAIAPMPLLTSARRWEANGYARTTYRNLAVLAGYKCGVSPRKLAAWYRRR